jgi:DNA-3-methyladenine glycosylase II
MHTLETETHIAEGVAVLVRAEPRFQGVVDRHGLPPLRRSPGGLPGLLRIVTDQLISLKAAEAIWQRVERDLAPFDAASLARTREATLVALGLSGAKARCFRAIAKAVAARELEFEQLHGLPDDEVLARLTAITGIGRWTAMIYLLASMGRADAWPVGDLALEVSAQHLLGLAERPKGRAMVELAEQWRPHRAVAARLLWSHYRGLKGMPQAVS